MGPTFCVHHFIVVKSLRIETKAQILEAFSKVSRAEYVGTFLKVLEGICIQNIFKLKLPFKLFFQDQYWC